MKTIELKSGAAMPALGLGTSQLLGETCVQSVAEALALGYRHVDTADMYGNHVAVGEGIRTSGVAREEVFLTTKIGPGNLSTADVAECGVRFLEELQTPYVDLLLIHWPNRSVPIAETLQALEALRAQGMTRAIGVSNFTEHHLRDAAATGVEVVANQVELHPTFNQAPLRAYCAEQGVAVVAYAPLGRGSELEHPLLVELGQKYGVSVAQVTLNWILVRGAAAIPRSRSREHLADNLKAQELQMEEADLARIDALEQGERIFNPAHGEFGY